MCIHDRAVLNRRHLGSLLLGVAGAAMLPRAASASAEIKAMCVTCIDYRFLNKDAAFVANDLNLFKDADILALAGASLSGVSKLFPDSIPAFWQQVGIAMKLHKIQKVVVVDHRDCGAFNEEFGKPPNREEETKQHKDVMLRLKHAFEDHKIPLALEFYLMPLEGCAERIIV
jgi:carbonic anhydrase